jgi:TATA-box binding protein (TBP) (component of TFIID and TFIIIB)
MPDNNYTKNLVNAVGSGELRREIDLEALQDSLIKCSNSISEIATTKSGLSIKFEEYQGTVILYRSGKYTIMGSSGEKELKSVNAKFISKLETLGIISEDVPFYPSNYVFSVDLDKTIDLNRLAKSIGSEAEFEPEQYAHVIYKPNKASATMTIAASGKCVVNSPKGKQDVEEIINELQQHL